MMMNIMMTMMITMMIPSMMTMMMTIMMTLRIHTCTMFPAHSLSPCWHSKCNSPFSSSVVWWRKFWSYVWWLWWHLWPFWWHYGKYVDNPVDIQNANPHLRLWSSNEEYFDHMSDIFYEVFFWWHWSNRHLSRIALYWQFLSEFWQFQWQFLCLTILMKVLIMLTKLLTNFDMSQKD